MSYEKDFIKRLQAAETRKVYNFTVYESKVPIKRGCPNKQCFCTGKCNEIIGYRDRLPGEF